MKYFILAFAILSIISQLPHAYWTISYTSNIEGKLSIIQNIVFCLIIATSILVLVFMELHKWALIGAIVETLINVYYVHCSYEEKYSRANANRSRKHRELIGAYFIGVLIPTCIYVFSYLYTVI